jgi:hypothetical protein
MTTTPSHRDDTSSGRGLAALRLAGACAALVLGLALAVPASAPAAAATPCATDDGLPCATTVPIEKGATAPTGKAAPREAKIVDEPSEASIKDNQIRWRFRNAYGRRIEYKLFAWNRNWSWPGGNNAFDLPANNKTYKTTIQCKRGEKVCYGAWVANNRNIFWGVGYNARYNCRNCCFTCKGVVTPTFVFTR